MVRPVSRSPQMTLKTPGGRNSAATSASSAVVAGVVSLGFSTTALPAGSSLSTTCMSGATAARSASICSAVSRGAAHSAGRRSATTTTLSGARAFSKRTRRCAS